YDEVHAVKDVNLHIRDKEFIVLVGPSGCGKTTTLRMLAGLERITSGEIHIGERLVNDLPPKDRDIAMVFQNYALYPHLTVYDNLAFGLRRSEREKEEGRRKKEEGRRKKEEERGKKVEGIRGKIQGEEGSIQNIEKIRNKVEEVINYLASNSFKNSLIYPLFEDFLGGATRKLPPGLRYLSEREKAVGKRVREVAELLQIESLLNRLPKQLSGGQKQRVALGRAMARNPEVFLMDEPLSNLDAKLRAETRSQIVQLQRQLGTTTIYVTHDHTEAMTMGDRIAVMNQGQLQQVAKPLE